MIIGKIRTSQVIEKLRNTDKFNNVSIGDEKKLISSLNEFLQKNPDKTLVNVGIDFDQTVYFIFEVENNFSFINNGANTYCVLHAFFNGLSDRTTYFGLHYGLYDFSSHNKAVQSTQEKNMVFYTESVTYAIGEIVRENEYIIIRQYTNGYYNASMKGLGVSSLSDDLEKLDTEFTEYVRDLVARLSK